MSGSASSTVKAEPNLTPILDMVFQLITFFMLVINFKSAEMDLTLKLPVVGSARPINDPVQKELLVLNNDSAGRLKSYGQVRENIESYFSDELQESLMRARLTQADLDAGANLPTTVVIRSDRATPFNLVYRVIKACQANGFRRFALKARSQEG